MKVCYVDVETTGVDPVKNGIIQLSGIIEIVGKSDEPFNFKVLPLPKDEIDEKALAVSGVSKSDLIEPDYTPAPLIKKQFLDLLRKHVDKFNRHDKFLFIGYNARFDSDFIRQWLSKMGDKYYGSWFWFPPIDVMNQAAVQLADKRSEMPNFKLMTVAKTLGIEIDEEKLHDAFYDIKVTRQLYEKLILPAEIYDKVLSEGRYK